MQADGINGYLMKVIASLKQRNSLTQWLIFFVHEISSEKNEGFQLGMDLSGILVLWAKQFDVSSTGKKI